MAAPRKSEFGGGEIAEKAKLLWLMRLLEEGEMS